MRPTLRISIASPWVAPELDWESIETAYDQKIVDDVRQKISAATEKFARLAPFDTAAPAAKARDRITALKRAAANFRAAFEAPSSGSDARFFADLLIDEKIYVLIDEKFYVDHLPEGASSATHFLANLMTYYLFACNAALKELSKSSGFLPSTAWNNLVQELTNAMQQHGLPATARKDVDKQTPGAGPSPFVAMLAELRRQLGLPTHSLDALASSINRARKPKKRRIEKRAGAARKTA